jgi:hypothetical protein
VFYENEEQKRVAEAYIRFTSAPKVSKLRKHFPDRLKQG